MVVQKIKIQNELGLHMLPAVQLANAAEHCTSKVEIVYDDRIINSKSILSIVAAVIRCGDEIALRCTGENEEIEKRDLKYMLDVIKNKL